MTDKGLKLLAKELEFKLKKEIDEETLKKLHVHEYGQNRKKEVSKLKKSIEFKTALQEAFSANRLLQDCINLNTSNSSELVKEYSKHEEAYDYIAEHIGEDMLSNAYTYEKEQVNNPA